MHFHATVYCEVGIDGRSIGVTETKLRGLLKGEGFSNVVEAVVVTSVKLSTDAEKEVVVDTLEERRVGVGAGATGVEILDIGSAPLS